MNENDDYQYIEELDGDVLICIETLQKSDTQCARRMLIRAVQAQIEAIVSYLKRAAYTLSWLHMAHSWLKTRSLHVDVPLMMALTDTDVTIDDHGRLHERPRFVRLRDSLQFSFRAAAKAGGVEFSLDKNKGWDALLRTIEKRNAITHPKRMTDVHVTEDDVRRAKMASGMGTWPFPKGSKGNERQTRGPARRSTGRNSDTMCSASIPMKTALPSDIIALLDRAKRNDPEAQLRLAIRYYDGHGVAKSFGDALAWFRRAAENGNAMAQYNLGWMCYAGEGLPQDIEAAREWFAKSAAQGFPDAQYHLGQWYYSCRDSRQSYSRALELYTLAANQGFIDAIYALASMYSNGTGVIRDYDKAIQWLSRAAEKPPHRAKALAEIDRLARDKKREDEREARNSAASPDARAPVKDERYFGRVLGLRGEVDRATVKRQYRELVVQYHPDKVEHLGAKLKAVANSEMKEINLAYEYFKNKYQIE